MQEYRSDDHPPAASDQGGDPVCWLNQVCPECGLFVEPPMPDTCPRCGSDLDRP